MLGLKMATDPRWVNLAEKSLEEILSDHAYCEQKAASTCISLIQFHSSKSMLIDNLAPIVTEEWGHFRQVLALLKAKNLKLLPQRKDHYVAMLLEFRIKGNSKDAHFLDQILMAALIEARSCERFRLLSENLEDVELQNFYRSFMEAEAGHYRLFIDIAKHYVPADMVKTRWQEWLEYEAIVMQQLSPQGNRIH